MKQRNRRPDLNGLLVLDKPLGWSSAKACARVRGITGGAKVGHAGTLDPLATGVLVLALGRATKSIERVQAMPKTYRTTVDLSAFTQTDDLESDRQEVQVDHPPTPEQVRRACDRLTGEIQQTPPLFSAIKVDGERAYRAARAGRELALEPRTVTVHGITIDRYDYPLVTIEICCSKGTYIRTIARDLGKILSTGGHLTALRRTAIGNFVVEDALDPEAVTDRAIEEALRDTDAE